jgi:hypothetical protein
MRAASPSTGPWSARGALSAPARQRKNPSAGSSDSGAAPEARSTGICAVGQLAHLAAVGLIADRMTPGRDAGLRHAEHLGCAP